MRNKSGPQSQLEDRRREGGDEGWKLMERERKREREERGGRGGKIKLF